MSRIKRKFTAEFKTKLVLEVLAGEKDLNSIAVENKLQPNLLRRWKMEFLANASAAFEDKKEANLVEKLKEKEREIAAYQRKVGQLTMETDWLKKKSVELYGPDYETIFSPRPTKK